MGNLRNNKCGMMAVGVLKYCLKILYVKEY